MQTRIIQLIARVKGDRTLEETLNGSSNLIDDVQLDVLQLTHLRLLIERELDINTGPECLQAINLSSVNSFAECIGRHADRGVQTVGRQVPRELILEALSAFQANRMNEVQAACDKMRVIDDANPMAHFILSCVRYPGASYIDILSRVHRVLHPKTYVEIGVATGISMGRALPPTLCVGIDPNPEADSKFSAETKIFRMTSDEFFRQHDLRAVLGDRDLELGFIDGLHLFENAFNDFINLEHASSRVGTILLHDCLPFDELTAARTPTTTFWTGDVWRLLPVLANFRPDLSIAVIECPPSGLGVIRRLDPSSDVLDKAKNEALAFGFALQYPEHATLSTSNIEVIRNDWGHVSQLMARS